MYVDSCTTKRGNKSYTRHLLRESYREHGKVKHRTVANLSHCSDDEIAAFKFALSHKGELEKLGTVDDVKTSQGMRLGAVFALNTIAEKIGLSKVLSRNRQGKLALWQVLARIIDQGSRLSAVRLADRHCAPDILGLDSFTEDDLYHNLAWLSDNQQKIERQLFRSRYDKKSLPDLFLYDVTSSYLEGIKNELADYGYNRDGKKGKKQIVIGLLCDPTGDPLAVRVFKGNTKDTATIPEQIRTLSEEFGAVRVTMVGDKGMIKGPQIADLDDAGFSYITSLSKPEIRTLLSEGTIQMGLFDKTVTEVKDEAKGIRYVLRRNPSRQADMEKSRKERIDKIFELATDRTEYLSVSDRRKPEVALRIVNERIERYKLKKFLAAKPDGRAICVSLDPVALEGTELLDGCYLIKTNLPEESIDKDQIHDRYKDLAKVENAFRTFKNGHLEVRPVFVRNEKNSRGHVFVVMLAYLIERRLHEFWRNIECTVPEGIDELGSIRGTVIEIGGATCQKIPKPADITADLLNAAGIKLPEVFPMRQIRVATRKKLVEQRN